MKFIIGAVLTLFCGSEASAQTIRQNSGNTNVFSFGVSASSTINITIPNGGNAVAIQIQQNDLTNNRNAMVITSTGTGIGLLIIPQGVSGGPGYQNRKGLLTLGDSISTRPAMPYLVIVDSTSDSQLGTGLLEIWSDNVNHNDPIFWIHSNSNASGPDMRVDSKAFNFEFVNNSTTTGQGMGKWEIAMAFQASNFQFNNRANDNTTFENFAYMVPLYCSTNGQCGANAGMYMRAQTLANDSAVLTSSDTIAMNFFTQNNRTVGLTGPLNTTASWTFALPSTFNNINGILYQSNNSRGNNLGARQWEFSGQPAQGPDFLYVPGTSVKISTLNITGSSGVGVAMTTGPFASFGGDVGLGTLATGTTFFTFTPKSAIMMDNICFTVTGAGVGGAGDTITCNIAGSTGFSVTSAAAAAAGTTTCTTSNVAVAYNTQIFCHIESAATTRPIGNAIVGYRMQ